MGRVGKELAAAAASMIVATLESHTRTLPTTGSDAAFSYARGWSLSRTTHDGPLRVDSLVRRVFVDGAPSAVDDAETYAQLVGFAEALRAAGFAVEEVFEGWRTVALDVVPELAPRKHDKHDKQAKRGKHDKAGKDVKGAKGEKAAKTGKADDAGDAGNDDERVETAELAAPVEPGERSPEPENALPGEDEDEAAGREDGTEAMVDAAPAAGAAPAGPAKERRGLFRRPRSQESGESDVPAGTTAETETVEDAAGAEGGPADAESVEPAESAKEVETAAA